MTNIKLAVLLSTLVLFPTAALAKTPDKEPPSKETVCDTLSGAEFGLCNAYCEASDCGDGVNYANWKACAAVQKNWMKKTGYRDFPCDCDDGTTYIPGEGCGCPYDLVIRILPQPIVDCPTGPGSCTHTVDIEVENLGSQDILDPFDALIRLPGISMEATVNFPAGLGAGVTEQVLGVPVGAAGDNCYGPNCQVDAEVDIDDVIGECNEENNTASEIFLG